MKLFNTLMSKIFGGASTPAANTPVSSGAAAPHPAPAVASAPSTGSSMPAAQPATTTATTPAPAAAQSVDVDAVLTQMASKNSEKLDYKKSIVDLMKLVGIDSSLQSRKELATELGYTGDKSDSATMNIWLHKQVLRKLAENGGKVPANLLD